jgi:hypothetical protein
MLKLTFKESSVITTAIRGRITREVSAFSYFISGLDLIVPPTPPIGIVTGTTQGSSAWVTGVPAYYSNIMLGEKSLHSQNAVTSAYSGFVFNQMVLGGDLTKNTSARLRVGMAASAYYDWSFWDHRKGSGDRWTEVFWKIKERINKRFADSLLAYTIKVMLDDQTSSLGPMATDRDIDNYIFQKLFSADLIVDTLNSHMPVVKDIIKNSPVQVDLTEVK